ncbi:MAG: hypothetical protein ACKOOD_03575 [Microbacteriaceae bacterium]
MWGHDYAEVEYSAQYPSKIGVSLKRQNASKTNPDFDSVVHDLKTRGAIQVSLEELGSFMYLFGEGDYSELINSNLATSHMLPAYRIEIFSKLLQNVLTIAKRQLSGSNLPEISDNGGLLKKVNTLSNLLERNTVFWCFHALLADKTVATLQSNKVQLIEVDERKIQHPMTQSGFQLLEEIEYKPFIEFPGAGFQDFLSRLTKSLQAWQILAPAFGINRLRAQTLVRKLESLAIDIEFCESVDRSLGQVNMQFASSSSYRKIFYRFRV